MKTFLPKTFLAFRYFPIERSRGIICGGIHDEHIFRDILEVHRKKPIDIIHANTIYSIPIATACKMALHIPFVCSVHNELLTAKPFFLCDKVLPVSNYLRCFLQEKRKYGKKMEILPDAINIDAYKGKKTINEAKEELGISNRIVILFVGRKCPEKGPEVLVRALQSVVKNYPDVVAVFLGPDSFFGSCSLTYTESLIAKARNFGLEKNVVFKGYVSERELQLYYNCADIFVCPSVWNEPFGMVLIEALGYKKPVVASRVGGIPEIIIDQKTGLLTQPGDSVDLSNKIVRLLDNPTLGKEMGANGRKMVEEHFSFRAIGNRCLEIYKKVLED